MDSNDPFSEHTVELQSSSGIGLASRTT